MSAVANAKRATSPPADAPSLGGTSAIVLAAPGGATSIQVVPPVVGEVGALLEPQLADEQLQQRS